jgi:putative PIN family toxin of toxin-antitoxin system
MKVVIDTNVLINGSNDESSHAFRIIKEIIAGKIEAYANHQTMSENRQMLRKLVRDREYRETLEDFFRELNIVKVFHHLKVVSDPEDNKLVESAAASGADYLITEDREILDLEKYHKTEILTPKDFWAKYKADASDDGSAWGDWGKMIMGG